MPRAAFGRAAGRRRIYGALTVPLIEVTLIEGRSADAKRALMRRLTDAAEETLGAPRQTIRVVLREVPAAHWSVGGEPKG